MQQASTVKPAQTAAAAAAAAVTTTTTTAKTKTKTTTAAAAAAATEVEREGKATSKWNTVYVPARRSNINTRTSKKFLHK